MPTSKITGIIHTKNESAYIAQCIKSLSCFVDEVLVVDMASIDDTVEIATNLGARVISVHDYGFVEPVRQLAVEAAEFDWIFVLDADEIVPATLATEIERIACRSDLDCVETSHLNFMFGKPIRHTGFSPSSDRHIRFFRKGSITFSEKIHGGSSTSHGAKVYSLPAVDGLSIHHFNTTDWSQFISKVDRYTTIEASQILAEGKDRPLHRVLWASTREFASRFVWNAGYRDGYEGFVLSCMMATYRLLIGAKVHQLSAHGDAASIREEYIARARVVAGGSTAPE